MLNIGSDTATIKMPVSLSSLIIMLGDNSPSITTSSSSDKELDANGVAWN